MPYRVTIVDMKTGDVVCEQAGLIDVAFSAMLDTPAGALPWFWAGYRDGDMLLSAMAACQQKITREMFRKTLAVEFAKLAGSPAAVEAGDPPADTRMPPATPDPVCNVDGCGAPAPHQGCVVCQNRVCVSHERLTTAGRMCEACQTADSVKLSRKDVGEAKLQSAFCVECGVHPCACP